jgi:DnaJ-class molecular chaperone
MTHYETLGIEPTATPDEIRMAFKRKAMEHHPDRHDGEESKGGATDRMKAVNQAYALLSDPEQRRRYDDPDIELHEAARASLCHFFASALNASDRLDLLDIVGSALELQETEAKENIERLRKEIAKFRRRRGQVKVKAGDNLVHMLIDAALPELEANIEKAENTIKVSRLARAMLTAYEAEPDEPDEQAQTSYQWRGNSADDVVGLRGFSSLYRPGR